MCVCVCVCVCGGIALVCGKNIEHKRVIEYMKGRVSFSNMIIRKVSFMWYFD